MTNKVATTIRLSDTIDHYARRVHINTRNKRVTMVFRWKDFMSNKAHTQRMTLTDAQVGQLIGSVALAADEAFGRDVDRWGNFVDAMQEAIK